MVTKLMEKESGWELKESTGSCLHVGIDEQCVEKAVETVSRLKEHLVAWKAERRKKGVAAIESGRCSRLKITSASNDPSRTSTVSFYTPESDNLVVLGLKTGHAREGRQQFDWSNADEVIMHILTLINRLESDRELTVTKWKEEREKVVWMRAMLDLKAAERLRILPLLVQQEHERFLKDLLELKWHISYENRQLQFIRDEVKLVSDVNKEFTSNLERTNDYLVLLQDKTDMEGDKMATIIRKQAETEMKLRQNKNELNKTAEKTHQTKMRTDSEQKQMKRTLADQQGRLDTTMEALSLVKKEQTNLKDKIGSFRSNISGLTMERNGKDKQLESLELTRTGIKRQVAALKERRIEQRKEAKQLEKRNVILERRKKDKCASLGSKDTGLLSEVQKLTRELRETRRLNEEMMCEMDEMKEKTASSQKRYHDSVHSIERARRELVRIDKQLQVIVSQTESIRNENRDLNEELQGEELKLGHIEDALRTAVQALKQDYQKEYKNKITFQGKIQADKADLEKMTVEHQQKELKTRERARKIELKRRDSVDRALLLEDIHQNKYKDEATLKQQIKETREELARVKSELGGKYSSLLKEKAKLEVEVADKRKHVAELKEQKQLLTDRSEDVSKSDKMIQRMETDMQNAIDDLKEKKSELQERMEEEKREEESWREELRDITEFSRQSKEKHTHYLIERERYLHQLEEDEVKAAVKNRQLAVEYSKLSKDHLHLKSSTFQLLEHQLKLEAALKDLGQLLALQVKLSTTMATYYKNRSITGIKDLNRFKMEAGKSSRKITKIRSELETVLSNIDVFLTHHDKVQSELIAKRHHELNNIEETTTIGIDTKDKIGIAERTKTVSFATPIIECTT